MSVQLSFTRAVDKGIGLALSFLQFCFTITLLPL
jgi:hypothetical protein